MKEFNVALDVIVANFLRDQCGETNLFVSSIVWVLSF